MKIAVITDDGKTISQHFGRAPYYMVFSVEDGKISGREMRDKLSHKNFPGEHPEEHHGEGHGLDPASHDRHAQMVTIGLYTRSRNVTWARSNASLIRSVLSSSRNGKPGDDPCSGNRRKFFGSSTGKFGTTAGRTGPSTGRLSEG